MAAKKKTPTNASNKPPWLTKNPMSPVTDKTKTPSKASKKEKGKN